MFGWASGRTRDDGPKQYEILMATLECPTEIVSLIDEYSTPIYALVLPFANETMVRLYRSRDDSLVTHAWWPVTGNVDGVYGDGSAVAVINYRDRNGLRVIDLCDMKMREFRSEFYYDKVGEVDGPEFYLLTGNQVNALFFHVEEGAVSSSRLTVDDGADIDHTEVFVRPLDLLVHPKKTGSGSPVYAATTTGGGSAVWFVAMRVVQDQITLHVFRAPNADFRNPVVFRFTIRIPNRDSVGEPHILACDVDSLTEFNTLRVWVASGNWLWTGKVRPNEREFHACTGRHFEGPPANVITPCGWNRLYLKCRNDHRVVHYLVDVSTGAMVTPWFGPYENSTLKRILHVEPDMVFGLYETYNSPTQSIQRYDFHTRKHTVIHQCSTRVSGCPIFFVL